MYYLHFDVTLTRPVENSWDPYCPDVKEQSNTMSIGSVLFYLA